MVALDGQSVQSQRCKNGRYSPSNQTPMLLDSSTESDLLADLGTGRAGKLQLGNIGLDTNDLGTCRGRSNVDHENFVLCQLGDLGLLSVCSLDTEQATEEEIVNLDFGIDRWKLALETEHETDKTIGTAQSRINAGADTC